MRLDRIFGNIFHSLVLLAILSALAACGGGGGGDSGTGGDTGNVGAGWIRIDHTTAPGGTTTSDSVYLSGEAFVSPTWFACCSGSAETISGVTVTWLNETTGQSGKASQRVIVNYVFFLLLDHLWDASIELVDGANQITLTATDPSGNTGRVSTTITRVPAPPSVIATVPAGGAANIPVGTPVSATFSEAMNPATIDATTFLLRGPGGAQVAGSVAYTAKVATFTPSAPLAGATAYTATVTTGARDLSGTSLAADRSWTFTTGSDYWAPITALGAPAGRSGHTAVWTGTQMIVWGGGSSTGGRYNPATDQWLPTETAGAPAARSNHVAAWTGSRMLIWGGFTGTEWTRTGGSYDPVTNTWTALGTLNAPSARQGCTAVWTGSRLIVWGGRDADTLVVLNTGASYNPANDTWTPLPTAPQLFRTDHTAVWTGSEMIVWGGFDGVGRPATGASYNPATGTWGGVSPTGAPVGRFGHSAVWTGTEMVVWGGKGGTVGNPTLNSGGRYDPATGIWRTTATTGAPFLSPGHSTVWTGAEMLVWGLNDGTSTVRGARYAPAGDSWSAVTTTAAPAPRTGHAAVWAGTEMLIWGGDGLGSGGGYVP